MESKTSGTTTAAALGIASCSRCLTLSEITHKRCPVCSKKLYLRSTRSVQKTLALLVTAFIFYIPANLYPIMSTTLLGQETASTIIGGVILFFGHGSYFVAAVIFTASIIIPIAKMLVIIWLCYCVKYPSIVQHQELSHMYQIVEFIGKWSMIDVFVVAILVALVQISGIMSIHPGFAAQAFAIVVILTMLAAQQFDIRLIWDNITADSRKLNLSTAHNLLSEQDTEHTTTANKGTQ